MKPNPHIRLSECHLQKVVQRWFLNKRQHVEFALSMMLIVIMLDEGKVTRQQAVLRKAAWKGKFRGHAQ